MDLDPDSSHGDTSTQTGLDPSCLSDEGGSACRSSVLGFLVWTALSEMEATLLSVVKDRKSQRKTSVLVDTLLQSTLTDRQVELQTHLGPFPDPKAAHPNEPSVSDHGGLYGLHSGWMCHHSQL